jgi:hypothetical protein
MEEEEFQKKYMHLRILKSTQDYLRSEEGSGNAVYPIRVPDDLLYQILKHQGADAVDRILHHIFRLGLTEWSEKLFREAFGSERQLEEFIAMVRERTR